MFLWTEAGKGMAQPLKPVDVGKQPGGAGQAVVKLDVVGAIRQGGTSMLVGLGAYGLWWFIVRKIDEEA